MGKIQENSTVDWDNNHALENNHGKVIVQHYGSHAKKTKNKNKNKKKKKKTKPYIILNFHIHLL